jgi:hypothetical protein
VPRQHRLRAKQQHAVASLRSRVRHNMTDRIHALDEQSRTRWNTSSKPEYEERLVQGIAVVPRTEKIDWVEENPFADTAEEDEAERQALEVARRLRRARCSTASAMLFRETQAQSPPQPQEPQPQQPQQQQQHGANNSAAAASARPASGAQWTGLGRARARAELQL